MVLIVLFQVGPTPLPIPSSLLGYSLRIFGPVPTFLLGYLLRIFGRVPTFLLGYLLRMSGPVPTSLLGYSLRISGPVPSSDCPSPRQSFLFFRQDLCHFIVVQVNVVVVLVVVIIAVAVVFWGARGASATAWAAFDIPRARAAGVAEVSGAA